MKFNEYNLLRNVLIKTLKDNEWQLIDEEWNLKEWSLTEHNLFNVVEDIIIEIEETFILKKRNNS